jgi:hypothetical protein
MNACERVLGVRRAAHAFQDARRAMLKRNVEIGKDAPFGHQWYDVIDVRVGVHVVHAHPNAKLTQAAREIDEARFICLTAPLATCVADVGAVRARVLRDD